MAGIPRDQPATRAEFDEARIGVVAGAGQHGEFLQFPANQPVKRRLRLFFGILPPTDEVTVAPLG